MILNAATNDRKAELLDITTKTEETNIEPEMFNSMCAIYVH